MTMKKILKEWKTYLKEEPDHTLDDNQVRANLVKKMGTILFAPINEPREQDRIKDMGGPESIIAMDYLYYAMFGEEGDPHGNIDAGKMFIEAKVKYFLEKLSNRELDILKLDAASLLAIAESLPSHEKFPKKPPTIPPRLQKQHPGLAKLKNNEVIMINGSPVDDWVMGGSSGYGMQIPVLVFQLIADSLSATEESPISPPDLIAIYSKNQNSAAAYDDDSEPGDLKNHPAAKMSYEELMAFIKSKQGK
jgi:hypothetical protein